MPGAFAGMVVTHQHQADVKGHGGKVRGRCKDHARDRGTKRDQLGKVKKNTEKEMELPSSPRDADCHNTKETTGGQLLIIRCVSLVCYSLDAPS